MDPKRGGAEASKARKRKMKKQEPEEVESKPTLPAPSPIRFFTANPIPYFNFSNALRFDLNTQPKPQPPPQIPYSLLLQENSDLIYPFKSSFTSLLNGVDEHNDIPLFIKEQNAYVDQLTTIQANQMNQLKRNLMEIQRRQYCLLIQGGEEKAAKKLKDKDLALMEMGCKKRELESENLTLKEEIKKLQYKVKYLENTTASIRAQLQEYIRREGKLVESGGCSGAPENEEQEDVESAHVDPNRVEPILLACRACGKRVATVMVWPCRHMCLCEPCKASVNVCPVCNVITTAAIGVCLP